MDPQIYFAVIIATFICNCLANVSNWDQEARDYILQIHNDRRRGEYGCQMNKMEYDMELEAQAKQWADGCLYKHELISGRGENLAWNSMEEPEKDLIKGSSDRWFDEKNMYSYGQHSCGSSCHYTQMVWDKTNKLGCYSTRCPYLTNAYANAWYFVCFYTPAGNTNGVKPYQRSCDTPCRKGQTEEDKLCVGDAEGASQEEAEEEECSDSHWNCPWWAKSGSCKSNPSYMLKKCRLSCKVCGGGKSATCTDSDPGCGKWAKKGECRRNPSYMLGHCKKSCQQC